MANKAERQRLRAVARAVAAVASRPKSDYRPTIADAEMADAFDAAMKFIGRPERAWRGTAAVRP